MADGKLAKMLQLTISKRDLIYLLSSSAAMALLAVLFGIILKMKINVIYFHDKDNEIK